jgi:hypothetical protein
MIGSALVTMLIHRERRVDNTRRLTFGRRIHG